MAEEKSLESVDDVRSALEAAITIRINTVLAAGWQ